MPYSLTCQFHLPTPTTSHIIPTNTTLTSTLTKHLRPKYQPYTSTSHSEPQPPHPNPHLVFLSLLIPSPIPNITPIFSPNNIHPNRRKVQEGMYVQCNTYMYIHTYIHVGWKRKTDGIFLPMGMRSLIKKMRFTTQPAPCSSYEHDILQLL